MGLPFARATPAVPGIGPKTFEQAAGFLRIRGGENPLDMTAVHPESYPVVEQIASRWAQRSQDLIAEPGAAREGKAREPGGGVYTLNDIFEELRKPGRDPREKFVAPQFQRRRARDRRPKPGMMLEGVVTNVTQFGAFVDIGVHQDGLVHISELSNRYIKDPSEVVKVGQIVKVQVLSADAKAKRIALSMKALLAPGKAPAVTKPKPQPTAEDKLTALSNKWKRR